MIFPSLYEGFGFPVLEALASGASVACSNTSALAEIANGYADFFDPYNVDDIAAIMEKSTSDGRRQQGIDYANSFTWKKTAESVFEIYKQLQN